jgi:hypothetical protein
MGPERWERAVRRMLPWAGAALGVLLLSLIW